MSTVAEELTSILARLSPKEQKRVLEFARDLAQPPAFPHTPLPPGSSPDALLRIQVDPESGEAMEKALEDTEQVSPDE